MPKDLKTSKVKRSSQDELSQAIGESRGFLGIPKPVFFILIAIIVISATFYIEAKRRYKKVKVDQNLNSGQTTDDGLTINPAIEQKQIFQDVAKIGTEALAIGKDKNFALVAHIIGTAKTENGTPILVKDSLLPGQTIITGPKSFVKIIFANNTTINIAPDSSLKIEATQPSDPSLVSLLAGQVRTNVIRDGKLNTEGKLEEKLVIKTPSAAMGVRGTDFLVSIEPNNGNCSLTTFDGKVAFKKLSPGGDDSVFAALKSDASLLLVESGMNSQVKKDLATPTAPEIVAKEQITMLKEKSDIIAPSDKLKEALYAELAGDSLGETEVLASYSQNPPRLDQYDKIAHIPSENAGEFAEFPDF